MQSKVRPKNKLSKRKRKKRRNNYIIITLTLSLLSTIFIITVFGKIPSENNDTETASTPDIVQNIADEIENNKESIENNTIIQMSDNNYTWDDAYYLDYTYDEEPSTALLEAASSIPEEPENKELFKQTKITELRKQYNNDDIIGYLKIDGTSIEYPVAQSGDNSYYIDKDLNGNYYFPGSIYLDYENNIAAQDKNNIIYGHNMNKDFMFHSLRYFADENFLNEHKYITFDTLYENQVWEVFAFYKTNINFNYIKVHFSSDEEFQSLIDQMIEKSTYKSDSPPTSQDRILTLSTCSNQEVDTRFVLNSKLISRTPYMPISDY